MSSKKGVPRRFVPGNTAFRTMAGIPLLPKEQFAKVPQSDREAVFKHVRGSDKWAPGNKKNAADDNQSETDDDEAADDQSMEPLDTSAQTALFLMELHPRVLGQTTPQSPSSPLALPPLSFGLNVPYVFRHTHTDVHILCANFEVVHGCAFLLLCLLVMF